MEEVQVTSREVKQVPTVMADNTANPGPIGLMGFGMTTVLLNLHNAGLFTFGSMILAMGIFYGGIAQVMAGLMDWRKNNTFGMTAFISYGFFWITLSASIVIPQVGWGSAPENTEMAAYLFLWGLFSAVMFIATLKLNRALQLVFGSLTLLFFLLVGAEWHNSSLLRQIAGYEGVVCGVLAIYTGLAQVVNEVYGRTIAPLGPVK